jgi:hypothetical protein
LGSATHAQRRVAVGGARHGNGDQRRRWLGRREVEDTPELGETAGPKGHDWAGWDARLKGFSGQKMREKGKVGYRIEF